jgi:hypothetical protein
MDTSKQDVAKMMRGIRGPVMGLPQKGQSRRFQVKQGKLSLSHPPLADLGCLVMELDDNGCRGSVLFQYVPADAAAAWRKVLVVNQPIHINIDIPPWLQSFSADALITYVFEVATHLEIELSFSCIDANQRMWLQNALVAIAKQKIRTTTQMDLLPLTSQSNVLSEGPAAPFVPQPAKQQGRFVVPQTAPVQAFAVPPAPPPPPGQYVPRGAPVPAHADAFASPPPPPKPREGPVLVLPPVIPPDHIAPEAKPEVLRAAVTMPSAPAPISGVRDTSTVMKLRKIGEVLVHMGQLKPSQVEDALLHTRTTGERLGRYLVRAGIVSPDVLCRALALQSGLPMTDLSEAQVPESLVKTFSHAAMLANVFVPFDEAKTMACIAAASPLRPNILADLQTQCAKKIEVFLAQEEQILKLLDGLQIKQNKKLRKHIRYEIKVPVQYQFCSRLGTAAEPVSHNGVTHNISEGGLLIEGTPSALGTPDDMRRRGMCVSIIIMSNGAELRGIGQLRAVREKERVGAEDPRWMLGVELVDMTVEDRRRLKEVCVKSVIGAKKATRQPFI